MTTKPVVVEVLGEVRRRILDRREELDTPDWRGYCECKWDGTRSKVIERHPACRFHSEPCVKPE